MINTQEAKSEYHLSEMIFAYVEGLRGQGDSLYVRMTD